ncbi:MAG: porin, partial [Muribaculaceae bacterium]|nr:porin [Muribaculaceae bacterium]
DNAPDGLKDLVPHFAIFGRHDKFYLGIGGAVRLTVGVDAGDPTDNPNEFITSELAPVGAGNHTKFNISGMQSNIFINFVGLPGTDNQIGAFFNMNFLNNYVPVVQQAYLKWRGIKAGLDYSAFSDNGAMPPTIDYEGPDAGTAFPVATLSYTYAFGKNKAWAATIGIEGSQLSQTNSTRSRTVNQAVPDIPLAIRYSWNRQQDWMRLSGIIRNMNYFNVEADKNIDVVGWGISLSGTAEIIPNLRAYWTGTYGHGIASYIQDLTGCNLDLTPRGEGSSLRPTKTWGAFGGLQYDFTPDVYICTSYSHVRNYARPWSGGEPLTWDDAYKYAQYVNGSLFWNVNTIVTTGVEYIYGRRVNNDHSQAHASRIQAMIQVSF